jgi:hypothetical protein
MHGIGARYKPLRLKKTHDQREWPKLLFQVENFLGEGMKKLANFVSQSKLLITKVATSK